MLNFPLSIDFGKNSLFWKENSNRIPNCVLISTSFETLGERKLSQVFQTSVRKKFLKLPTDDLPIEFHFRADFFSSFPREAVKFQLLHFDFSNFPRRNRLSNSPVPRWSFEPSHEKLNYQIPYSHVLFGFETFVNKSVMRLQWSKWNL